MKTSGLSSANWNCLNSGTVSPHWYTALSEIPRAVANDLTLPPNTEITKSVRMGPLNHTLQRFVKCTFNNIDYDFDMTPLEKRVLEALEATGLAKDVLKLSEKIGVTRQAVYDWLRGRSIENMKGKHLIKLSELSGFEPLWIMEGKGPRRRKLTDEQQKVLIVMQESQAQQSLVVGLVESAMKYHKNHDDNTVDDRSVSSHHDNDESQTYKSGSG